MEKHFTKKDIWIRIAVILISGMIIWRIVSYLNNTFFGQEYHSLSHFIMAVITTVLTVAIIKIALKIDKLTWSQLGQSTVKQNALSCLLGFFLWAVPACIGFLICYMLGWVEISVHTDWKGLFLSILLLCITVFLMEALPEELIFRGYIYRFLHALFPHWGTIILQALLFTLFAFAVGALYSAEQIQFIPGFAIILGVFRAISGNVWISIGFHVAIMTATQILGPVHGHFDVSGMFTLQLIAFILLPSVIGATILSFIHSNHNWNQKDSLTS